MLRSLFHSLVRTFLPRHRLVAVGVACWTLIVVVALLVAQSALGFGRGTPAAQAAGGGGGGSGGCAGVAAAICHLKGNTADAELNFISPDGCIQTTGRVFVVENATSTPPNAKVSGNTLFMYVDQYDLCAGTPLLSASAFASGVDYKAARLAQASVDATLDGQDDLTGAPVSISLQMSWQGIGGTTTTMDRSYYRSPTLLTTYRYAATSRYALVTGSFTVGTTVIATPPNGGSWGGMSGSLFDVQDGSFTEEVTS